MKKFILFLCFIVNVIDAQKADLVVFSYNRPMQLYTLLESVHKYMTGIEEMHVIYRASNERFAEAYEEVADSYSDIYFVRQDNRNPKENFKPLTLQATFNSPSDYIIFAVDDIIVKDYVDLSECIDLLEQTNAYGFYLRLGLNLTECYMLRTRQPLPQLAKVNDDVYAWRLGQGRHDWGYPNTVDMTLYRKKDIAYDLNSLNYTAPNVLEGCWAGRAGVIRGRYGLCFGLSKIVNIPLNRVQNDYANNRFMHSYSPQELLELFERGLKNDIESLFKIKNKGAHAEYNLTFVERCSREEKYNNEA